MDNSDRERLFQVVDKQLTLLIAEERRLIALADAIFNHPGQYFDKELYRDPNGMLWRMYYCERSEHWRFKPVKKLNRRERFNRWRNPNFGTVEHLPEGSVQATSPIDDDWAWMSGDSFCEALTFITIPIEINVLRHKKSQLMLLGGFLLEHNDEVDQLFAESSQDYWMVGLLYLLDKHHVLSKYGAHDPLEFHKFLTELNALMKQSEQS